MYFCWIQITEGLHTESLSLFMWLTGGVIDPVATDMTRQSAGPPIHIAVRWVSVTIG